MIESFFDRRKDLKWKNVLINSEIIVSKIFLSNSRYPSNSHSISFSIIASIAV
jgi:hypothetical protein